MRYPLTFLACPSRIVSQMSREEYRNEDSRVNEYLKGDLQIGDQDLQRIFRIQPPPIW